MRIIQSVPTLPPRADDAHKGHFGTVLIIAGSRGMGGAAALAGKAALRSGAGLVRVACPQSISETVAGFEPAYTTTALPEDPQGRISDQALACILDAVQTCDVIAVGPGLGTSHALQTLIETLIRDSSLKLVLDADGLNNLSRVSQWPRKVRAKLTLTPHAGEMTRLWASAFRSPLAQDRNERAAQLAKASQSIVTLKGAQTVVTDGESVYINQTGNPGMATGGSGDVLTGMIAALIGQGQCPLDATILGTYVHGLAGDLAARDMGRIALTAPDIIDSLPKAWLSHEKQPL
ncbi:MAG: NAD(P)H-hydrate dehydratase [Planctomycetes bacterium]|nr:NAD(P)H-hydrate dehydratase [Planctomycetota bacterium]